MPKTLDHRSGPLVIDGKSINSEIAEPPQGKIAMDPYIDRFEKLEYANQAYARTEALLPLDWDFVTALRVWLLEAAEIWQTALGDTEELVRALRENKPAIDTVRGQGKQALDVVHAALTAHAKSIGSDAGLKAVFLDGTIGGIGKTALLEALFLFFDRYNPDCAFKHFSRRGFTEIPMEDLYSWGPLFHKYSLDTSISLTLTFKDNTEEEVTVSYAADFQMPLMSYKPSNEDGVPVYKPAGTSIVTQGALEIHYQGPNEGSETKNYLYWLPDKSGLQITRSQRDKEERPRQFIPSSQNMGIPHSCIKTIGIS